jgi:protein-S-isoprenylcysteine O-methyltransferase Ste14
MNEPGATRRRPAAARIAGAMVVSLIEAVILTWALGGFETLWRHARALALIGCWTISGVVLAASTPGRGREAVAKRAEGRIGLLALGLIPLVVAPLAAWGERIGAWPLPGGSVLRWAGVALAAAGLSLRVSAMARLGERFAPILTVQPGHRLETRGLYARIRHPGYLGAFLASLGAALAFGSALGLAPVAALAILLAARARREEEMLAEHFGEEWRRYRTRSGAFWPR